MGALVDVGVTHAFGISGGAIALFADALRDRIEVVHCRHESGAAFAATELSLATGRPAVVFTTTGPGLTNALTGLAAARSEGAHVVLVSGASSQERRGRHPFQETASGQGWPWLSAGSAPDERLYEAHVETPPDLQGAVQQLHRLVCSSAGGVVRVLLSTSAQACAAPVRDGSGMRRSVVKHTAEVTEAKKCAERLGDDVVVWLGFGARHAAAPVRRLVEARGWHVMATPRGKGILPEGHPLYLGVTGLGGDAHVLRELGRARPEHVVVLGSRLGEFSSFWHPGYLPSRALVHVDVDPTAFGSAYREVPTMGVCADVGAFVEAMLRALPPHHPPAVPLRRPIPPLELPASGPRGIHPAVVMSSVQRVVVDGSDAIVMTEAGNTFAWGSCALRFDRPRYRVSTSFGAMGQASAGILGAALATGGKAVALVGDGAMLMNNEVSTAVQYGAQAVWVVFNDAKYGMVEHGMRAIGLRPIATEIPRVDFAALGAAMGAVGLRVDRAVDLDPVLMIAMTERRPVVVDVRVDPDVPPPFGARNASLRADGVER